MEQYTISEKAQRHVSRVRALLNQSELLHDEAECLKTDMEQTKADTQKIIYAILGREISPEEINEIARYQRAQEKK